MKPVLVGVLGCGKVSHQYFPNLLRSSAIKVVAVGDVVLDNARAAAELYSIPAALEPDRVLADPNIELVLNLTPISSHVTVTQAALDAGKHVYSEKPFADTSAAAIGLLDQARRRSLTLGCAPDTLLGSGFQAGRDALLNGAIGKPMAASAMMFRRAFSRPTYGTEASPFFDMAPYYLSALVNLFGPAQRVTAIARIRKRDEAVQDQDRPVIMSGTIQFADDVMASVTVAWGTGHKSEVPVLTVYGADGVLRLPNPNTFGEPALLRSYAEESWHEVTGSRQPEELPFNLRGLGVAEMALAARNGSRPRAGADLAAHVVEIITGLVTSATAGQHVDMTTTCDPSESISAAAREELLR